MKFDQIRLKPIVIGIITLVVVLAGLGLLFGEKLAEKILERKISGIENLHFDRLDIDIASRSITVTEANYISENAELQASEIQVEGIEVYTWIFKKEGRIKAVEIDSLSVVYHTPEIDTSQQSPPKIPDKIKSGLFVENIEVKGCHIIKLATDSTIDAETTFDLAAENLHAHKILKPELLMAHITRLEAYDSKYKTKNRRYVLGSKTLKFESTTGKLVADSIYSTCLYGQYELGHIVGHETPWIDFRLDSISVTVDSLKHLVQRHDAQSVVLYRPKLLVFTDKRLPFPHDRRPKFLSEFLADTTFSIGIDSIVFVDGDVIYEEFVKQGAGPGKISFEHLNGYFSNIYSFNRTHPERPRLVTSSHAWNTSLLYTDISFPNSPEQKTNVKVKLEPMNLTTINRILKYVAFIEVQRGYLYSLDFDFSHDHKEATGKMNFAYDRLKIEFLNKQDADTGGLINDIKGFLANTLIVHNENTYESGKFRVGNINWERDLEKSIFAFWWQSIYSGLKSSTGIPTFKNKIDQN